MQNETPSVTPPAPPVASETPPAPPADAAATKDRQSNPKFPRGEELHEFVAGLDKRALNDAYQFGAALQTAVNHRWKTGQ